MVPSGKNWRESKTLWFNIIAILVEVGAVVLAYFGYGEFVPEPWVGAVLVAIVPLVNIILRWFTREPIRR